MDYWSRLPCAKCDDLWVTLSGGAATCMRCGLRRPELDSRYNVELDPSSCLRVYPRGSALITS